MMSPQLGRGVKKAGKGGHVTEKGEATQSPPAAAFLEPYSVTGLIYLKKERQRPLMEVVPENLLPDLWDSTSTPELLWEVPQTRRGL